MTKLKHITVSEENYLALQNLGKAATSFNDVITKILLERNVLQTGDSWRDPQSVKTQTSRGVNPNG